MSDDDRSFVRDLLSGAGVPADVVRGAGPARADYLKWNAAVGTTTAVTQPGEPMLDVDGIPHAMPEPTVAAVTFGGVAVTVAELARVGLTPGDVPNLSIIGAQGGEPQPGPHGAPSA